MGETGTWLDDLPEESRPPIAAPWEDVKDHFATAFPEGDQEVLKAQYTQSRKLGIARAQADLQGPEAPANFLLQRAAPVASPILRAGLAMDYGNAKKRFDAGNPQENDYHVIARHEKQQAAEAASGQTWHGTIAGAMASTPGFLGEAALGGALVEGLPVVGRAAPAAAEEAPAFLSWAGLKHAAKEGVKAAVSPRAIATTAAEAPAMPSLWAERWVSNNLEAGRSPGDVRGLAPAVALGIMQMQVMKGSGAVTAGAFPEQGIAQALGRVGIQGATGPFAQAASDVLGYSAGLQTNYGSLQDLREGRGGDALRHATMDAVTFAGFAALHDPGGRPARDQMLAAYQGKLQEMAKRGMSKDAAGRALLKPFDALADLHRTNPDPTRSEVAQAMLKLPEGPSRDWGMAIAQTMPEKQPQAPQQAPEPPQASPEAPQPQPAQQAPPAPPQAAPAEPPAPPPPKHPLDAWSEPDVKALAKSIGLSGAGSREAVIKRLTDSLGEKGVEKIAQAKERPKEATSGPGKITSDLDTITEALGKGPAVQEVPAKEEAPAPEKSGERQVPVEMDKAIREGIAVDPKYVETKNGQRFQIQETPVGRVTPDSNEIVLSDRSTIEGNAVHRIVDHNGKTLWERSSKSAPEAAPEAPPAAPEHPVAKAFTDAFPNGRITPRGELQAEVGGRTVFVGHDPQNNMARIDFEHPTRPGVGSELQPGSTDLMRGIHKLVSNLAETGTGIEYRAIDTNRGVFRKPRPDLYAKILTKAGYEQTGGPGVDKNPLYQWRPKVEAPAEAPTAPAGSGEIAAKAFRDVFPDAATVAKPEFPGEMEASLGDRRILLRYDPDVKAVNIDFENKVSDSRFSTEDLEKAQEVPKNLRPGSLDLSRKLMDLVSKLKDAGLNIQYAADEHHRAAYARLLRRAGYEQVGEPVASDYYTDPVSTWRPKAEAPVEAPRPVEAPAAPPPPSEALKESGVPGGTPEAAKPMSALERMRAKRAAQGEIKAPVQSLKPSSSPSPSASPPPEPEPAGRPLTKGEAQVMAMRQDEDLTMEQVGKRMGISKARVEKLEKAARVKLKQNESVAAQKKEDLVQETLRRIESGEDRGELRIGEGKPDLGGEVHTDELVIHAQKRVSAIDILADRAGSTMADYEKEIRDAGGNPDEKGSANVLSQERRDYWSGRFGSEQTEDDQGFAKPKRKSKGMDRKAEEAKPEAPVAPAPEITPAKPAKAGVAASGVPPGTPEPPPDHLKEYASEIRQMDKAGVQEHNALLTEARQWLGRHGKTISLDTVEETSAIRGFDEMATAMAERYPNLLGRNPEQKLFDLLKAGNKKVLSAGEIQARAQERVDAEKQSAAPEVSEPEDSSFEFGANEPAPERGVTAELPRPGDEKHGWKVTEVLPPIGAHKEVDHMRGGVSRDATARDAIVIAEHPELGAAELSPQEWATMGKEGPATEESQPVAPERDIESEPLPVPPTGDALRKALEDLMVGLPRKGEKKAGWEVLEVLPPRQAAIYKDVSRGTSQYHEGRDAIIIADHPEKGETSEFSREEWDALEGKTEAARISPEQKAKMDRMEQKFGLKPEERAAMERIIKGEGKPEDEVAAVNWKNRTTSKGQKPPPFPWEFGKPLTETERRSGLAGGQEDAIASARQPKLTALANAQVDRERQQRQLPPLMQAARLANPDVWDRAMARLDTDPNAAARLVDELAKKTRATTVEENALLLQRKIALSNEHGRVALEYVEAFKGKADAITMDALEAREASIAEQRNQLDKVTRSTGTEWGRAGQFRRQLAAEDYSLGGMLLSAEAAKGKPLTVEEKSQIAELQKRIEAMQKQLDAAQGQLEQSGKGINSPAYPAWRQATVAEAAATGQFKEQIAGYRQQNRTWGQKLSDLLIKIRINEVISSPVTLAKIAVASASRFVTTPMEEAAGAAWTQVPGIAKIAAMAPREGRGLNLGAEKRALVDGLTKGMKDAADKVLKGKSELDILHGPTDNGPRTWLDLQFGLHDAMKAPAERAEYTRSFLKRIDAAVANGEDATSPAALLRMSAQAYVDGQRAKFRGENWLVDAYNRAVNELRRPSQPAAAQAAGTGLKLLTPVLRVPTNLAFEVATHIVGVPMGAAEATHAALTKGLENLKPAEAETIMRHMKKGSLGLVAMALGYFAYKTFGGYYSGKRDDNDAPPQGAKVGDTTVPAFVQHNPMMEVVHFGATVRRAEEQVTKGKKAGLMEGLETAGSGLAQEIPLVREAEQGVGITGHNAHERGWHLGELAKSLVVPQFMQWIAGRTDTDVKGKPIQRKPTTTWQHVESGIPVLRQNVPIKR